MGDRWSSDTDIDIGSRSYRVEPGIGSSRCAGRGKKEAFTGLVWCPLGKHGRQAV